MRPTSTAFVRRRRDSVRSDNGSVTPADELSSWLGDDVCTTCGTGVRAGQLYCSQECREEETNTHLLANNKPSSSAPTKSSSASQLHNTPHHHRQSSKVSAWANAQRESSDSDSGKFRYVCPPSPHVLASKYGSHLTSPALAALDRQPTTTKVNGAEGEWTSSSERRSSSRSTYSSASDNLSTDPSTPSPLLHRSNNDDLDELDASDFNLPPSVIPTALQLKDTKQAPLAGRSPVQRPSGLPSVQPSAQGAMSFARRPSRTNVPPPVLFTSPVLATTVMRASTAVRRDSHSGSKDTPSSNSSPKNSEAQKLAMSWQQAKQQLHDAHFVSNAKRSSVTTAAALPVGLRSANAQVMRKAIPSPPLPNSASSSAGRTLRAMSPPSAAVSLSSDKAIVGVCGRHGCQGLSGSSIDAVSKENRPHPSLNSHHKHTHSANAGLNLLGREEQRDNVEIERTATPTVGSLHATTESTSVKSPPRGRSKARGRSSTSRRDPSPPRGAARRGRSEDIRSLGGALAGLSMAAHRAPASRGAFTVETQDDADDEDDERIGRRGRSPTERAGLALNGTGVKGSGANGSRPGRHPSSRQSLSSGLTARGLASGYDEVDLDEL